MVLGKISFYYPVVVNIKITGNYIIHIFKSSKVCLIIPDITINFVSFLYLLIINIPFFLKILASKRVAGYLFCTGSNLMQYWKYHLKWQMMLHKSMCITFLPVQNKYPANRVICQNFYNKRDINNQKVQVADEIKHDIWKYLVSSDVADNA